MPLYPRNVSITLGTTGLAPTLGLTVYDVAGTTLVSRLNFFIESPTLTYTTQIANFDSTWSGNFVWDNNGTVLSTVPFTGTPQESPYLTIFSYISVEDANAYFNTILNAQPWERATPTNQAKALSQATRLIERLNFIGVKASCDQPYQWPRIVGPRMIGQVGTGIIPNDIQYAVCELALALLDGIDPDLEDELLGSESDAYATVRITSDSKVARDHIKAGIISITAWRLLLPWLQDPRSITLRKG